MHEELNRHACSILSLHRHWKPSFLSKERLSTNCWHINGSLLAFKHCSLFRKMKMEMNGDRCDIWSTSSSLSYFKASFFGSVDTFVLHTASKLLGRGRGGGKQNQEPTKPKKSTRKRKLKDFHMHYSFQLYSNCSFVIYLSKLSQRLLF